MEDLTLQQLESLAIGYFECRLSRAEEEDLKKVLLLSPLRSDLLDECRLAMGLEATLARSSRQQRKTPVTRWFAVAATAALLLCATTFLLRDPAPGLQSAAPCYAEVYINGVKVSDQKVAAGLAEQWRRQSLERMDSLLHASIDSRDRQLRNLRKLTTH